MDENEFTKSIKTYKISLSWIDIKIIKFVKNVKKFGNRSKEKQQKDKIIKKVKKAGSHFIFLFLLFLLICTLLVRDRLLQCFALKAGLARHPAMGKYGAGTPGLLKLWISG